MPSPSNNRITISGVMGGGTTRYSTKRITGPKTSASKAAFKSGKDLLKSLEKNGIRKDPGTRLR
jgi:hypothetical protein